MKQTIRNLVLETLEDRVVPTAFLWDPTRWDSVNLQHTVSNPNRSWETGNEAAWFDYSTNTRATVLPGQGDMILFQSFSGQLHIPEASIRHIDHIVAPSDWQSDIVLGGNTQFFIHNDNDDTIWQSGGIYTVNDPSWVNFVGGTTTWSGGSMGTTGGNLTVRVETGSLEMAGTGTKNFGCQFWVGYNDLYNPSNGQFAINPSCGDITFTRNNAGIRVSSSGILSLNNTGTITSTASTPGKIEVSGSVLRTTASDGTCGLYIQMNYGSLFTYAGSGDLTLTGVSGGNCIQFSTATLFLGDIGDVFPGGVGSLVSSSRVMIKDLSFLTVYEDATIEADVEVQESRIGLDITVTPTITTLNIDGDLTLSGGTRIDVEVFQDSLTNTDAIKVTGDVQMNYAGNRVDSTQVGQYVVGGHNHAFLQAEGSINGTFTFINSPFVANKLAVGGETHYIFQQLRNNAGGVAGLIFRDDDFDGVLDPGEPGLSGATVELRNSIDSLIDSTTSDSGGNYSFEGITTTDDYYILVSYSDSVPVKISPNLTDAGSSLYNAAGKTASFPVGEESQVNNQFAGIWVDPSTAVISGYVWDDQNENGQQDTGEVGLDNAEVTLYNDDGDQYITSQYTSSGAFSFTGLVGAEYYITVRHNETGRPMHWTLAQTGSSSTDSDIVSNNNTSYDDLYGISAIVVLDPGENYGTLGAGLWRDPGTSSIGGYVWEDLDEDGIQDEGEPGLASYYVEVWNTTTATMVGYEYVPASGGFNFTGLYGGTYYIVITHSGYHTTLQNQGSDDDVDSDYAESYWGCSELDNISLAVGQAGLFDLGLIYDEI